MRETGVHPSLAGLTVEGIVFVSALAPCVFVFRVRLFFRRRIFGRHQVLQRLAVVFWTLCRGIKTYVSSMDRVMASLTN